MGGGSFYYHLILLFVNRFKNTKKPVLKKVTIAYLNHFEILIMIFKTMIVPKVGLWLGVFLDHSEGLGQHILLLFAEV